MTSNHAAPKVEDPRVRPRLQWPHPHERTGVRFVLTNVTDPSHADDYSAWYDDYGERDHPPGRDRKCVSVRERRRFWD